MLSFCISDTAKQMLLSHSGLISHLLDGLLLDPEHPRKDTAHAIKTIVQRDYAECIQQISLFPPGCEALRAAPGVVEAKDCARGALIQLTGRHPEPIGGGVDALHIMVSCECTRRVSQVTI
jgi:hypothetical protein